MGGFLIGTDPTLRTTKTPTVDTFAAGVGFTAGSSTTVSLSADPGSEKNLTVFFDGVGQHRSTYSVSGTTVTFDTAIPTGTAEVEATFAIPVSSVTVSDDSVTLAKMASGTDGNIISYDASGNPVAIATGNDGQVLTSTGAGSPPAFEAAAVGGLWKEIATGTNSAALTHEWLDGTGGVVWDTTYDDYILDIRDIDPGGTSSPTWFLHEDGGSYLTASNYWWRSFSHYSSSDEFAGADSAANGVLTGGGNQWHSTSAAHYFISIHFRNTMDAIDTHLVGWMNRPYDTGPFPTQIEAIYNGTELIDGFKITAGHTWTCTWRLTGRTA